MQKIGRADEAEMYRKFLVEDPDTERWKGGPDEEINPEGKDNYLLARQWFETANEALEHKGVEQHIMDTSLFIAYPYRAQMEYARNLQKDGIGEELTSLEESKREVAYQAWASSVQNAWDTAYREWVDNYGRARIQTTGGGAIVLESDDAGLAELKRIAQEEGAEMEEKLHWQNQYRKLASYPYWKRHCEIERRPLMTQARYEIAEGRYLYHELLDFGQARDYLERGMDHLDQVIREYQVTDESNILVDDEQDIVEEALKATIIWQQVMEILGQQLPDTWPLQQIWNDPNHEALKADLQERFLRWHGGIGSSPNPE
jgi:hypothetical protein